MYARFRLALFVCTCIFRDNKLLSVRTQATSRPRRLRRTLDATSISRTRSRTSLSSSRAWWCLCFMCGCFSCNGSWTHIKHINRKKHAHNVTITQGISITHTLTHARLYPHTEAHMCCSCLVCMHRLPRRISHKTELNSRPSLHKRVLNNLFYVRFFRVAAFLSDFSMHRINARHVIAVLLLVNYFKCWYSS